MCLSISDYHPDTWNPAWSVSTILTGLLSFMVETTPTSGSIESSEATVILIINYKFLGCHSTIKYFSLLKKKRLAQESKEYNLKDKLFCELFPGNLFFFIVSFF